MQFEKENASLFQLTIDDEARYNLRETAKWARFLAIVGYILMGLFTLGVIIAFFMMASVNLVSGISLLLVYIVITALYFYPVYAIYKFSSQMKTAMNSNDQLTLNSSLKHLKNCFRYMGIVIIIVLSFYAIGLIFLLISSSLYA